MKDKDKHCYNCIHLEELYDMVRNDDGRFERVLVDVECSNPKKGNLTYQPCEHFNNGNGNV